jgi:dihydroneopterin aldolase
MDIVYIHDLRIETTIGVYDWERRIRQTLVIDLDLGNDNRKAAARDDLTDTIDYGAVATRIRGFVEASEFQLIESLAERIAEILLGEFKVPWLRVKITKQGALRGVRDVGVLIERGKHA